jgi:hypothetical protein
MGYFDTRLAPFVRAFIISDALLYSALNIVNLLFVVYVTTKVPGGTIGLATAAVAVGLVARIIVELSAGRFSSRLSEPHKLALIIGGMAGISISYAGFAITQNIWLLGALWVINGAGWALAHPTKLALMARHVNHAQSSQEWATSDALNMSLIVVTMAAGSYVVSNFSYTLLFALAAVINTLGLVPFLIYAWRHRH